MKLTETEITERLAALPGWRTEDKTIFRDYKFADFLGAMRFVNAVADAAEEAAHHPDILISYNRVTISLSTHDAGGITDKDFALAATIDSLA